MSTHINTITENSLSIAVNNILNIQTGNQTSITNLTQVVNQLVACACPGGYVVSTPHAALTGSDSLAVSNIVGMLVQIADRPSGVRTIGGNPPYLWDMGYVSLSNADGVLAERRITWDSYVWLPTQAYLATTFGWWVPPGVTLTVWELAAAPP